MLLLNNLNPVEEKRKDAERLNEFRFKTFKILIEIWFKRQAKQWIPKHASDVSSLKNNILPFIGERPIKGINAKEVYKIFKKLEDKSLLKTVYRIRQRIESIFNYSIIL